MKRGIALFLSGVVVGAGVMFAAYGWHFVQSDDGWHVVRNSGSSMTGCYADVRGWTAGDWSEHPELAAALVEGGHGDVVMQTTADGVLDTLLNRQ